LKASTGQRCRCRRLPRYSVFAFIKLLLKVLWFAQLLPYLPAIPGDTEELRSDEKGDSLSKTADGLGGLGRDPFLDESKRVRWVLIPLFQFKVKLFFFFPSDASSSVSQLAIDPERANLLRQQKANSPWADFLLGNELIVRSGPLNKRKGFFTKRRQFILTDLPRLIYINEEKVLGKKMFFFLLLVFICFPLVDGAKGRNPLVRWSQSRTQKQQDLFRAYCSPDVLPRGSEQRSQQVGRRHPRNPQMIRHAIFFAFLLLFFVSFPPVHTHVLLYDAATNND